MCVSGWEGREREKEKERAGICISKDTHESRYTHGIPKFKMMSPFYPERDRYYEHYFSCIRIEQYITNRNNCFIHCEAQTSFEVTGLTSIYPTTKAVLFQVY